MIKHSTSELFLFEPSAFVVTNDIKSFPGWLYTRLKQKCENLLLILCISAVILLLLSAICGKFLVAHFFWVYRKMKREKIIQKSETVNTAVKTQGKFSVNSHRGKFLGNDCREISIHFLPLLPVKEITFHLKRRIPQR